MRKYNLRLLGAMGQCMGNPCFDFSAAQAKKVQSEKLLREMLMKMEMLEQRVATLQDTNANMKMVLKMNKLEERMSSLQDRASRMSTASLADMRESRMSQVSMANSEWTSVDKQSGRWHKWVRSGGVPDEDFNQLMSAKLGVGTVEKPHMTRSCARNEGRSISRGRSVPRAASAQRRVRSQSRKREAKLAKEAREAREAKESKDTLEVM